jgi:hypothetical protein
MLARCSTASSALRKRQATRPSRPFPWPCSPSSSSGAARSRRHTPQPPSPSSSPPRLGRPVCFPTRSSPWHGSRQSSDTMRIAGRTSQPGSNSLAGPARTRSKSMQQRCSYCWSCRAPRRPHRHPPGRMRTPREAVQHRHLASNRHPMGRGPRRGAHPRGAMTDAKRSLAMLENKARRRGLKWANAGAAWCRGMLADEGRYERVFHTALALYLTDAAAAATGADDHPLGSVMAMTSSSIRRPPTTARRYLRQRLRP